MPDGTSRFSINGQTIYHFMGCSTFSGEWIISLTLVYHLKGLSFDEVTLY